MWGRHIVQPVFWFPDDQIVHLIVSVDVVQCRGEHIHCMHHRMLFSPRLSEVNKSEENVGISVMPITWERRWKRETIRYLVWIEKTGNETYNQPKREGRWRGRGRGDGWDREALRGTSSSKEATFAFSADLASFTRERHVSNFRSILLAIFTMFLIHALMIPPPCPHCRGVANKTIHTN